MSAKLDYINPEVDSISAPEYPGQYYESMVPATLDLAERASLSVNALTETTNPEYDYELYWVADLLRKKPAMWHSVDDHVQAKFFEALPLVRTACGSAQNIEIERSLMETYLRMQGPDGLLYAAPGDGGTAGDPECDAQRADSRLGKVLRIDPVTSSVPQVVANGLRNPFRFSFDRLTGDFVVGDVGNNAKEEIDFVPAAGLVGANFGWNVFEGNNSFSTSCAAPPLPNYAAPSITYDNPASGPAAVCHSASLSDGGTALAVA